MAVGVDRGAGEGVIGRNRAVRVQAQDLAVEGGAILRRGALLGVAHRPIELAVRPELHPAAVVIAVAGYPLQQHPVEHPLAGGRILAQPDQAVLQPGAGSRRVGDVDETVLREPRVERQPEQAGLAGRGHIQRQPRLGEQLAVLNDANAATALGKEDAAVRREIQRPGRFEA